MQSNLTSHFMINNCDMICLNPSCGDTLRLIPANQYLLTSVLNTNNNNPLHFNHKHQNNLAKIQDILDKNFEEIKCISSYLQNLQNHQYILDIMSNFILSSNQDAINPFQNKELQEFCIAQAQKISKYYQQTCKNYLLEEIRNHVISYRDNKFNYKLFTQSVSSSIEVYNIIENQIYLTILIKMNEGIKFNHQSNAFDCIEDFTDKIISMKMELLQKTILNHSYKIEIKSYVSQISFSYLLLIFKIYQKFNKRTYILEKDKNIMKYLNQNLVFQFSKYGEYFIQSYNIQAALDCYYYCIELNSKYFDAYMAIINIFKKVNDKQQLKLMYQLTLLKFPTKLEVLTGILDCLDVFESQSQNIATLYQYEMSQQNIENVYQILFRIFKEKVSDVSTSYRMLDYQKQKDPMSYLNSFLLQILRKSDYPQTLNTLKCISETQNEQQNDQLKNLKHSETQINDTYENVQSQQQITNKQNKNNNLSSLQKKIHKKVVKVIKNPFSKLKAINKAHRDQHDNISLEDFRMTDRNELSTYSKQNNQKKDFSSSYSTNSTSFQLNSSGIQNEMDSSSFNFQDNQINIDNSCIFIDI